MRKLKLDLDALNVDSFQTARAEQAQGTVRGHVTNPQEYQDSEATVCTCDTNTSWFTLGCASATYPQYCKSQLGC